MDRIDSQVKEIRGLRFYDPVPYGQTDIGRVRRNNEDFLLLFDPELTTTKNKRLRKVFAVADGVGGRLYGEVASKSIIEEIRRHAVVGNEIGHEDLRIIDSKIPHGASTLVLAQQLENGNDYLIDSIGDSSPLLIDTAKGIVTELTRRDENSEGKVTQVMGPEGGDAGFRRANRAIIRLRQNQTLLLATDGFTKYMDNGRINKANLIAVRNAYAGDNANFVRELIMMANIRGGTDNITIISIPFDPKYS